MLLYLFVFISGYGCHVTRSHVCLQIGKYDRQFWEQSVEQEVLKVLLSELLTIVSTLMLLVGSFDL